MSDIIYSGKDANKGFIDLIDEYAQSFRYPSGFENPATTVETKFKIKDSEEFIYTTKDNEEAIELLYALREELANLKGKQEELFAIPCVSVPLSIKELTDKNKRKKGIFYVTPSLAKHIVQNREKCKNLLGIEFPEELYQLTRSLATPRTDTIPGYNFYAPPLRKYKQTATEYENELSEYYNSNGYQINYDHNGERTALPHEEIQYSDDVNPPKKADDGLCRESYSWHQIELREEKGVANNLFTRRGNSGLKNNQRKKIKSTRMAEGKLESIKSLLGATLKPSRIGKTLLCVFLVGMAANAIVPVVANAGLLVFTKEFIKYEGIFLGGYLGIKNRKKIANWLKERRKKRLGEDDDLDIGDDEPTNTPTPTPDPDPVNTPTQTPTNTQNPVPNPSPTGTSTQTQNPTPNPEPNPSSTDKPNPNPNQNSTSTTNQAQSPVSAQDAPGLHSTIKTELELIKQYKKEIETAKERINEYRDKLNNGSLPDFIKRQYEEALAKFERNLTTAENNHREAISNLLAELESYEKFINPENEPISRTL